MGDTLDVVTLAEAKAALNISSNDPQQNTELAAYITAISLRLDGLCGPVIRRTITSESHNGGCASIVLNQYPVTSVTAVTEYDNTVAQVLTAETNSSKTANDYFLDSRVGAIRRRGSNSWARFPYGVGNVEVTYVAGRYASTTSASANFKQAATIMLGEMWRRDQGAGTVTFGETTQTSTAFDVTSLASIPRVVVALLSDEILAPRV